MAGFTDYLEAEILDHVFGGAAYTAPATLYIALGTSATTPAEGGTGFTEPSGNAYARVAMTNNATNFPAASGGAKTTGTDITFPTATGSWGTIRYVGIYDADTAGHLLGWAQLAADQAINTNNIFKILAGDLDITLD